VVNRGRQAPLVALGLAAALVGLYLALGGATYKPLEVADPCEPRPIEELEAREGLLQSIALSALDGAACELQVPREDLVFALADPEERARFAAEHQVTDETVENALRAGLVRAVEDAAATGQISGIEETLLLEAAERVPVGTVIDALEAATGDDVLSLLDDLVAEVSD
jgi:hypothetical protein